jgi:hypothetical protein
MATDSELQTAFQSFEEPMIELFYQMKTMAPAVLLVTTDILLCLLVLAPP